MRSLTVLFSALALAACSASTDEPAKPDEAAQADHDAAGEHTLHWDYGDESGPAQWASLHPDFALCGTGTEQSPIDLQGEIAERSEVEVRRLFEPVALTISFQESTVEVLDNGHTIQIGFEDGNSVEVGGVPFALSQYHFHAPSEHTVNGRHSPMEVHFVHVSEAGNLAVVGVLIEEGEHNAAFDPVWENLPQEPGETRTLEGVDVDLDALVPRGSGALRYRGSLTTPPCSEGVQWFVREDPIELSAEQIATFTALISGNNRPVQPLNERTLAHDQPTYLE